ncbi:MAG TPA: cytochrome P450, partial [Acidimicrobiia bacterium]|nr:cytochrome P450 [Acidimicrobiia bacterium]
VLTCLGSANRDPSFWGDDADALDLHRANARQHVSFGSGVHHCLGAALARMEAQEAIGGLVRRFPALALAGEPRWNGRVVLRGLDALPVTLH